MKKPCLVISFALMLSLQVFANTIHVPEDYPTIGAAISAAVDGDSILVGPGVYDPVPTVYNSPNNITLLGNGFLGPDRTTILGNLSTEVQGKIEIRDVDGWEIGGFELTVGKKGIVADGNNGVYIHDVYVHDVTWYYAEGIGVNANNVTIERCVIAYCEQTGIDIWYDDQLGHIIRNNTILNCPNGILIRGQAPDLIVENNIIVACSDGVEFVGSYVGSEFLNYNDMWNNPTNWSGCQPGPNNIYTNPLFVGGTGGEQYMLQENSPCIDAGNPNSPLDPDGTRADIGCFYYDQGAPGGILTLTCDPVNPPIIIPMQGGSFDYTGTVNCDLSGWAVFDAWAELRLPNGYLMGPLYIRPNIRLDAGESISRTLSMYVSAWAMPGTYEFIMKIGDSPNTVVASDSFSFEKLVASDWNSGEQSSYVLFSGWGESEQVSLPSSSIASGFELSLQPTPNPFNPTTVLSYELQTASHVVLRIYDTAGRLVTSLVDGMRDAGNHQLTFDGSGLASGIYVAVLRAGNAQISTRLLLLK